MTLQDFRKAIRTGNTVDNIRNGLIGDGSTIPGLFGDVELIYADYMASGRALRQIEDFVQTKVLPFYSNSHTEASYCGGYMNRIRAAARDEIARITNAGDECSVIFTGSGATSGLNRLVRLMGVETTETPVVFIGPYEHHANILPWRESRAKVIEIPECPEGGPCLNSLKSALEEHKDASLKIGSFSAASNVTGIITDPIPATRLLKQYNAKSIWDYAGGAPYLPIDMSPCDDALIDAVVVSPHKFPGGPASSGVLLLRQSSVDISTPSWPGGGTVTFVSSWDHQYTDNLAAREEAGTPNVVGDIRAALAFIVKDEIGQEFITCREAELNRMGLEALGDNPHITILGKDNPHRLPVFSLVLTRKDGSLFHHQLFTRMLSDVYGIQVRGGCACAGPYAHQLLEIDQDQSSQIFHEIRAGNEILRPGWARFNLSYLMTDEQAQYVLDCVNELTSRMEELEQHYTAETSTARFKPQSEALEIA